MRFNFLKQKYVSRKIINAINVLQFFIYKNGANQPFAFDLWWLLLNINHSAWCSKSARLLVRDRLGSNCVRKKSARVLLGSKVARNFSARSAILIEDDRIEMLEQLKFLLVYNPNPYSIKYICFYEMPFFHHCMTVVIAGKTLMREYLLSSRFSSLGLEAVWEACTTASVLWCYGL